MRYLPDEGLECISIVMEKRLPAVQKCVIDFRRLEYRHTEAICMSACNGIPFPNAKIACFEIWTVTGALPRAAQSLTPVFVPALVRLDVTDLAGAKTAKP